MVVHLFGDIRPGINPFSMLSFPSFLRVSFLSYLSFFLHSSRYLFKAGFISFLYVAVFISFPAVFEAKMCLRFSSSEMFSKGCEPVAWQEISLVCVVIHSSWPLGAFLV